MGMPTYEVVGKNHGVFFGLITPRGLYWGVYYVQNKKKYLLFCCTFMCFHEYTAILDLRKMAQTITITFASKRPSSWQNRWHVSSCIARRFSPTNVSSKTTVVRWCTPTSHHCPILGLGSDTSLFFGVVVVWILSGQSPQRPGSAPKHMAHQCSDLVLMKFVYFRRTTPA